MHQQHRYSQFYTQQGQYQPCPNFLDSAEVPTRWLSVTSCNYYGHSRLAHEKGS
ncbi:hypothetical protein BDW67DRAFT_171665 [Aspergillus spinulosporus]